MWNGSCQQRLRVSRVKEAQELNHKGMCVVVLLTALHSLADFRIIAPLMDNWYPFQMRTKMLVCLPSSKSPKFKVQRNLQQAKGTTCPLHTSFKKKIKPVTMLRRNMLTSTAARKLEQSTPPRKNISGGKGTGRDTTHKRKLTNKKRNLNII